MAEIGDGSRAGLSLRPHSTTSAGPGIAIIRRRLGAGSSWIQWVSRARALTGICTSAIPRLQTRIPSAFGPRAPGGGSWAEIYTYDALGRRVTENPGGTLSKSLYYSSAWQVLEEDWSGAVQVQYVWSPVYVDAMIERDRGSERFYVQQDANWNVTAIVNATTGVVQERYVYDPYGQPTILDVNLHTLSASAFAWVYLHQGGRYDTGTGLYSFRNRDYSPTLGRWMELDPAGLNGGDANLYRYVTDDPLTQTDPTGLWRFVPGMGRFHASLDTAGNGFQAAFNLLFVPNAQAFESNANQTCCKAIRFIQIQHAESPVRLQ
jgi:RHS repeat-associated protein